MFGVLTIERKKNAGLWEKLRLRLCPRTAVRCETDSVRMAVFLKVTLTLPERAGPRLTRRRLRRCMALMRLRGIHRAVLPPEAECEAQAACIAPIRAKTAVQSCAADAVLLALRAMDVRPEQTGVTLIAERAGRDVQTAAFELARRVRCVRVCSRVPAPALRRRLYEEYGIAEHAPPSDACGAALVFDETEEGLEGYGAVCNLCGHALRPHGRPEYRCRLSCAPEILARKPPEADESDFTAALYLCRGLTRGYLELRIDPQSALDREGKPQYNKD